MTDKYGKIHTDGSRSGGQPVVDSIEAKAVALLNEIRQEYNLPPLRNLGLMDYHAHHALCRAIEAHEAFKQEVSDALVDYFGEHLVAEDGGDALASFVIPKTKPDPLVEAMLAIGVIPDANHLRAALDALGFEIREKGQ